MTSALDNRRTCTWAGDARDAFGRVMGPNTFGELLVVDEVEYLWATGCALSRIPNAWGCHDPQCDDSTWDHECPTGPCTVPAHTRGITRGWFRYATQPDLDGPQPPDVTPLEELPAWLVGADGYVEVTCAGCGNTGRARGGDYIPGRWALCPNCQPDAARILTDVRDRQ